MSELHGAAASLWFDTHLGTKPIMAVLRGLDPAETVRLSHAAWDAGCEHVEIPIETPEALPSLSAAIGAGRQRGKVVGAGTIVSPDQAATAIRLGSAYLVSPGFDRELVLSMLERNVPFLPAVATASEILAARAIGLRWLKAFPASLLGSAWITAMHGPFPDVRFVATGGMNAHTAASFLAAGCAVIGVGGAFADAEQIDLLKELLAAHD